MVRIMIREGTMKSYTVAELKTHASRILSSAQRDGTDALITRHGRPMALIVPVSSEDLEWSLLPQVRRRLTKAMRERAAGKTTSLKDALARPRANAPR
jgi:prevent-host-death family protein